MAITYALNRLKEIGKTLDSLDYTEDLVEEDQKYLDNFPYIFAQAILCEFTPDRCKQITNHLLRMLDNDSCDFLDRYAKVIRCWECKWYKDNKCTNLNGICNNTILDSYCFCSSGVSSID